MTTRIFNALLAIWLFVTAFMWPHGHHQFAITLIAAVLTFVLSIFEIYSGAARYLNVVVAIFLFLTAITIPGLRATTWNNAIVAIAIFVSALVDRGPGSVRQERELYGDV